MSTIGNRFRLESRRPRFYASVIIGLLAVVWLQSVYYDWRNGLSSRICVVHDGTYYIGSADPVMVDDETNIEIAKDVAASVFDRIPTNVAPNPASAPNAENPISTLKWPEKLVRIVNTEIRDRVINDCKRDNNQFLEQQATQTFQLTQQIAEQRVNDSSVKMLLQGDLMLTTRVQRQTQTTSKAVRITMLLTRNDDYFSNHKYPKVCTQLNIEYPK